MQLLPRMNDMLDFNWTLPVQEHGTSEHYKKILFTVGHDFSQNGTASSLQANRHNR